MSNDYIAVQAATYGAPNAPAVDVTIAVQEAFDKQVISTPTSVQLKNISPSLFGIPDPAPGKTKSLTVVYNLAVATAKPLMRGAQDGNTLTIVVSPPNQVNIIKAIYANALIGLDVTDVLNSYLADPAHDGPISIGSQAFWNVVSRGSDPSPGNKKYFSAAYTVGQPSGSTGDPLEALYVCGYDGQSVSFSAS